MESNLKYESSKSFIKIRLSGLQNRAFSNFRQKNDMVLRKLAFFAANLLWIKIRLDKLFESLFQKVESFIFWLELGIEI